VRLSGKGWLAFAERLGLLIAMRQALPIAAMLLFAGQAALAAAPSPLDDPQLPGRDRYERCVALAQRVPQAAYNAALQWQGAGGQAAAIHCSAIALVAMHRYVEAATQLDRLAHDRGVSFSFPRVDLLDQAGNAWLLANQPANAEAAFTTALVLAPGDPDILADRARARAAQHDWKGADADLTAALARAPDRAELWVLRASARHAMGQRAGARGDIARALQVSPGDPEALVERGAMRAEDGDANGAVADWQAAIAAAPASDAAQTARQYMKAAGVAPAAKP
jgi:tetratricopeptide (TPR) repeat protein